MEAISVVYTLNQDNKMQKSYVPPDVYLGTRIQKFQQPYADDYEPHCVRIHCPLINDWIKSTQAQILFSRQIQNGDT